MVIMMKLNAPKEDIDQVKEKILASNCKPHEIYGSSKIAIGVTGNTANLPTEDFLAMDSVEEAVSVSKPYKLVSREKKSENTIIKSGETSIGGEELTVIASPCSVESRPQTFEIADELKE